MALLFPLVLATVVAFFLGGRLERIGDLRLEGVWAFFAAFVIQLIAYPFEFFPWRTDEQLATYLAIASYGLLVGGAVLNRHIRGVTVIATGMAFNLAAIMANDGFMPVLPKAQAAAGIVYDVSNNSAADAAPTLALFVDRWAAPDWVPYANVYSVGDVVIAIGLVVVVLAGMQARLPFVANAERAPA